jgi:hypothetical protein
MATKNDYGLPVSRRQQLARRLKMGKQKAGRASATPSGLTLALESGKHQC